MSPILWAVSLAVICSVGTLLACMMSAINQDDEDTPFDEILDNLEAVVGLASRAESLASGWCCCGGRSVE